jgi:hypothetical protein
MAAETTTVPGQTEDGMNGVKAAAAAISPFPTTYAESFKLWWRSSRASSEASERSLIARGLEGTGLSLSGQQGESGNSGSSGSSAGGGSIAEFRNVQLEGGKERFVHMLELGKGARSDSEMPIGLSVFIIVVYSFRSWSSLFSFSSSRAERIWRRTWVLLPESERVCSTAWNSGVYARLARNGSFGKTPLSYHQGKLELTTKRLSPS